MARPMTGHEPIDRSYTMRFTQSEWDAMERYKAATGMPIAEQIRRGIIKELGVAAFNGGEIEEYDEVPLLGTISGGAGICVVPTPPETMCRVPLGGLPADVYALWVQGDSMESLNGNSIPDGSYAFFQPQSHPTPGATVHVEWEVPGDDRCQVSLKKWVPDYVKGEATFIPFNKAHKPFVKKFGEFTIRGAFIRHYKPEK